MVSVILGCQWGDEGKAKVVDYLSGNVDYVVRFQGGANAGHTVHIGEKKYVFHLVPSGILRPKVNVVVGNGVVLDIQEFLEEIELVSKDVDTSGRIFLSNKAHVVMPYHKLIDGASEKKTSTKIGTTGRGIGPAYADKLNRIGIRVGDLYTSTLKSKIELAYNMKKYLLENYFEVETELPTVDNMLKNLQNLGEQIKPYVTNTEKILREAYSAGKNILFEGAQGALLDIDFGTYPFVTSSSTGAAGVFVGSGLGYINEFDVIAILKAYTTRVGEGPFPTEDFGKAGEDLRRVGNEFGATTGRPRRCGWFDLVLSRYSLKISGVKKIFLTKLDVLDGVDSIKVCTAYELDGKKIDYPPSTIEELAKVKPVYEEFPGWDGTTVGAKDFDTLPDNAKSYIKYLEKQLDTPIAYVSTGYERNDVVERI